MILRGIKNIAPFIGEKPQTAQRMCRRGEIPGAFKRGWIWLLDREVYERSMREQAEASRNRPKAA